MSWILAFEEMTRARLSMPALQLTGMVEEVVRKWEEEEDVVLVTMDGKHLPASSSLLALHSPLLADLLSQRCCRGERPMTIYLPTYSANLAIFLTLVSTGEATFDDQLMLEEVKNLASDLGINLDKVGTFCQGGAEQFTFGPVRGVHCLFDNIGSQTDLLLNSLDEGEKAEVGEVESNEDLSCSETVSQDEEGKELASECYQCPKMFKSKSRMKLHAMLHPNFMCHDCEKGFRFRSTLQRHMSKHHSPQTILEANRVNTETDITLKQFKQLVHSPEYPVLKTLDIS